MDKILKSYQKKDSNIVHCFSYLEKIILTKLRVAFHGTGFIGLVSAACLATRNIPTICSTFNEKKAHLINQGIPPFYENGLAKLLRQAKDSGNFKCVIGRTEAVLDSDISMITVGTPMRQDRSIDLRFIHQTAELIGKALNQTSSYHTVVTRSTVVPGTTRNLIGKIIEEKSGLQMGEDFGLCMQPEFLAEGRSILDTLEPDRIIIGEYNTKSGDRLERLYREFYNAHLEKCPILRMNLESAELVKYGNNCLLATKISYANEMARIAELVPGVDIEEVIRGVGLDYRINPEFLGSGVGFGGSCLPKDVNAILAFANEKGYNTRLFKTILDINEDQALHAVEIIKEELIDLSNKRIALLGLSFKPGTDDTRYAPSIRIAKALRAAGATVVAHDPVAEESVKIVLKDEIIYAKTIQEALDQADGAILVTEWEDYRNLSPDDFLNSMKTPIVVDGRHVFNFDSFSKKLRFRKIGRRLISSV